MKKYLIFTGAVTLALSAYAAPDKFIKYSDIHPSGTETILHAWSWNFRNIAENMKKIADAGYSMVQTSPVQQCWNPEGSKGMLYSDNEKEGQWYFYYQPTDWKIGNHIVGSRDEMKQMLDSAAKYNIRVIVDVLPNHTAFDVDAVSDDLVKAVGGRDKLYHSEGLNPVKDYNDRYQCTLWGSGALPDVNTENKDFQKYYMQFVNDLLDLGVRGFRYDTAKHIGVHSDPVDTASGVTENDFWDVATGQKAVKGVRLNVPYEDLFVYGEVLQDKNVPEREYEEYFGQTASSYGWVLREMLEKGSAKDIDIIDWRHTASPETLTTWVESHDTYCNAHESAHLTDDQIRTAWVFLTARDKGTPLFFSRPAGSTRDNYWGHNRLGDAGNDEYFHPEVVAVNHFRKEMAGQPEKISTCSAGEVIAGNR
ncbi:MAG: alpha-amylase family protein, partial [Muribaculaceae bacterium]|nr:alpha-amylase family protein [Muribaculaceae bacterium]